jgi:hypothetical protein
MFTLTTKKAAEIPAFAELSAKQQPYPTRFQFAPIRGGMRRDGLSQEKYVVRRGDGSNQRFGYCTSNFCQ